MERPGTRQEGEAPAWTSYWFVQDENDSNLVVCDWCLEHVANADMEAHLRRHRLRKESINNKRDPPVDGYGRHFTVFGEPIPETTDVEPRSTDGPPRSTVDPLQSMAERERSMAERERSMGERVDPRAEQNWVYHWFSQVNPDSRKASCDWCRNDVDEVDMEAHLQGHGLTITMINYVKKPPVDGYGRQYTSCGKRLEKANE